MTDQLHNKVRYQICHILLLLLQLPDMKTVADVAVSVDSTWQKHGHSSRILVAFILLIDTGEVLDCYKVFSVS